VRDVSAWLFNNWFALLQGVGIVAGLLFTGISLRREAASRRLNAMLTLTAQHRDLWNEVHRRPELGRILSDSVDLVGHPITLAEEEFLNIVFVHFSTGWELSVRHGLISRDAFGEDVRRFFQLPIPKVVWERTKGVREPGFVRFVAECLPEPPSEGGRPP
jgi:hypothetical protein